MDSYDQYLRQLVSDLASFAAARRPADQQRAMAMIEYSTSRLRDMLDAGTRTCRPPLTAMTDLSRSTIYAMANIAEPIASGEVMPERGRLPHG